VLSKIHKQNLSREVGLILKE